MLEDLLTKYFETLKDDIIDYISNYGQKRINSIICWSAREYQQGLWIYSSDKNQYSNVLEAFIELWTAYQIDMQEWNDSLQSNKEYGKSIFENFFMEDYKKYNIKSISVYDAKAYVHGSIEKMLVNMAYTRKRFPIEVYNHKWPSSVHGIYVNGQIVAEDKFEFNIVKPILRADELRCDYNWAGYRELFIETEDQYIYLNE